MKNNLLIHFTAEAQFDCFQFWHFQMLLWMFTYMPLYVPRIETTEPQEIYILNLANSPREPPPHRQGFAYLCLSSSLSDLAQQPGNAFYYLLSVGFVSSSLSEVPVHDRIVINEFPQLWQS